MNEFVPPDNVRNGCRWHAPPGQCRMLICHCNPVSPIGALDPSVADPINETVSPTLNVWLAVGEVIVTTGGGGPVGGHATLASAQSVWSHALPLPASVVTSRNVETPVMLTVTAVAVWAPVLV